jgi:serine protease Do
VKWKMLLPLVMVAMVTMVCGPIPAEPTPTLAVSGGSQGVPTAIPPGDLGQGQSPVGASTTELAKATVQVLAMVPVSDGWQSVWHGSGSIISPDGLILTNAHVVDNRRAEYSALGVALTDRTDQPPVLMYLAEIVAVDYDLDLAVIRIASDSYGSPVSVDLPYVRLGDSDSLEIGDQLRILGYPAIGGETITFTQGAVSGFTAERGVEGRAWIKTDTTIAGGNSGGLGVNAGGELVGVPTRVKAGGDEIAAADCRVLVDTNRDGVIDDNDDCIPVGGFINGLRPVNLALPLVQAALAGQQYVAGGDVGGQPDGGFDMSAADFYNIEFADGVTEDDRPTQVWYALPSGTTMVCAFWDYEGMANGMRWSSYWFIDGELDENASLVGDVWSGGPSGNWWGCILNEQGLPDGLYEFVLEVEGESLGNESIFVGGDRSLVDFTLVNQSSFTVCYVQLSPSLAQNWGQDELGPQETISAGSSRAFPLVTGSYDLRLLDCSAESLLEQYGLEISGDFTFTLTD